jgi:hypothetical protein
VRSVNVLVLDELVRHYGEGGVVGDQDVVEAVGA